MKINVGISNRHIHLTEEDYKILFGDIKLEKKNDLTQPGQYACTNTVTIKGPKREINNVRLLGPLRSYTQVEISKTDSYTLGVNPPVRNSGDLLDAENITIIGPNGTIERKSCIIATRHIHISHEDRVRLGLLDVEKVKIKTFTEKSTILENVYLKELDNSFLELHLDTDDGNANLLKQGDLVEIIK